MPRILPPRKNPVVDMTAMCDVAFLLLTFFILTAKFKPQNLVAVDVPLAHSEKQVDKALTIIIDKKGRAFISVKESSMREEMLNQMIERDAELHPQLNKITDEGKKRFKLTDTWGSPLGTIDQVLALDGVKFEEYQQQEVPGIPYDSLNNELGDWVQSARIAYQTLNPSDATGLQIAIKSDKGTNIPYVKDVIKTLTSRDIHRFLLITTLGGSQPEAKPEGEAPKQ
ncbi:MAG: biopolymer transporter ExbD [Chitinophagales bacterium]